MKALLPALLPLSLVACLSGTNGPNVEGPQGGCQGAGCGRGGTAAASGRGGSGGTASSSTVSGGASSGSGSSVSSSSSGGSSGQGVSYPDAGGCANGYFVSQLVDVLTSAPIGGATVGSLDANGVPLTGAVISDPDGTFVLCGPPEGAFSPAITADGYAPYYRPEIRAGGQVFRSTSTQYSVEAMQAISSLAPGGLDMTRGIVIALVGVTVDCPDASGFVLTLVTAEGGALAAGGYSEVYLDTSDLPDANLAATSASGEVMFYDVDLSAENFFAVTWSNPQAGSCPPALGPLTGRVYAAAGAISSLYYDRP